MDHYEKLQAMYAVAPINRFFLPKLQLGHGEAEVRITVRPDFHHSAGGMHGSVYFKALDDATFFAAQSLEHEVFVLTAHFEIDLLKPVAEGEIQALARVYMGCLNTALEIVCCCFGVGFLGWNAQCTRV